MAKKRTSPPPKAVQPARDSTRRQLFMAKLLCVRGGATASSGLAVDRVVGILLLEKAVETGLNAIVDRFGGGAREPTFASLWKAAQALVAKHMAWELPFKAGVDHIHHLRTGVQHHGLIPSPEDGGRAAAAAYEFTREVASQVFQVDIDALTLPEIVRDEQVGEALSDASALLEKGENKDSVQASARAFERVASMVERDEGRKMGISTLGSDEPSWSGTFSQSLHWVDPLRTHFSEEQSRALQHLRRMVLEVVTALVLGVELPALRRFRGLRFRAPEELTREDALFALNFAFDCALRSESGAT